MIVEKPVVQCILEALADVEPDQHVGRCVFRHRWSSWVLTQAHYVPQQRPLQARRCRRCGKVEIASV